jgi:hypothetical protein
MGQLDAVPLALPATKAFMLAHEPGGADMTGTGQENRSGGLREVYIHLGSRSLPKGIEDAEAVVLMVPHGASSTDVSIYVHVRWFPSRTAAENLDPAKFLTMTVSAVVLNPKLHHITRTIRSAADIDALVRLLNGFPAAPDTAQSCPGSDASYQVSFDPQIPEQAPVTVTTDGCYGATVTVGGVPQPPLLDSGNTVAAIAARELGVGKR